MRNFLSPPNNIICDEFLERNFCETADYHTKNWVKYKQYFTTGDPTCISTLRINLTEKDMPNLIEELTTTDNCKNIIDNWGHYLPKKLILFKASPKMLIIFILMKLKDLGKGSEITMKADRKGVKPYCY